jgi:hypothetical protein
MILPSLPKGFVQQCTWSRSRAPYEWEFYRVYDPSGRLVPEQSYWMVSSSEGEQKIVRYGDLAGRSSIDFFDFSAASMPLETLRSWAK